MKIVYLLCFIAISSWCVPRDCTPAEAASISCNVGADQFCLIDAEEYQGGASKNIPHCIKTFPRTWTIDSANFVSNLAQDHYHIYVSGSPGVAKDLFTALDDRAPGVTQRVINGKLNTRVNGDMATIGATVMISQGSKYNFNQGATKASSITTEKEYVNDGSFAVSSYALCQGDFVYDPNKFSYCKNSASSTFDFSEKGTFIQNNLKGKNVVYARLYWGGSAYQNWMVSNGPNFIPSALNYIKGYSKIDFKAPGKPVITIDAEPKDLFWFGSFSEYQPKSMTNEVFKFGDGDESYKFAVKSSINYIYSASADVTKIVQDSLGTTKESRTFYAGNIRSTIMPIRDDYLSPNDREFDKDGHAYHLDNRKVQGSLLFAPVEGKNGYWGIFIAPQFAAWSLVIIYDFDDETAIKENIEPKMVSIFDGLAKLAPDLSKKNEPNGTEKLSTVNTKFSNVYTPKAGNIDASLTMFSFGGKIEVGSENIEIKKGENYESITSGHNSQGQQFNSTMTKFGQLINKDRAYNNLVDLDIFDISNKMTYQQKEADVKFTVATKRTSEAVSIERIYLALAGFSTRIYRPEVCYVEELYYKEPNETKFKKATGSIEVARGTELKTIIKVLNRSNEDAEEFALKAVVDPSQIYSPNSTIIVRSTNVIEYSDTMLGREHYNDNTGLQHFSGSDLTFFLGQNADTNKGGLIKRNKGNYAYAVFETKLQAEFKENSYKATVANASINLEPYDTYIKKCDPSSYNIKIKGGEPNNFIPSNKPDDGSGAFKNRLLTQVSSKPFDLYITNYGVNGDKRAPDSPVDVKVELVASCGATSNLYEKDIKFSTQSEILLPDINIDSAHRSVKVRISHLDKSTNKMKVECENLDDFAIRPSHFRLWNNKKDALYTKGDSFIGGQIYDSTIALAAMRAKNKGLANGYINTLDASLTADDNATCKRSFLDDENKLSVIFADLSKALGKIIRHTPNGDVGFSYTDIGETYFKVVDSSFTLVDQHTSSRADDCVINSDENDPLKDPAAEGRVGCNIRLKEEDNLALPFRPNNMQISNIRIIKDDDVTYLDNDGIQKAKLSFDVSARLSDKLSGKLNTAPTNPSEAPSARLYKEGCYANETSFELKLHKVPLNFTDNEGNAGTLEKANEEILFFEILGSNTKRSTDPSALKGTFYVEKGAFKEGKAGAEVFFNFARKINRAKNPFTVSSEDFKFDELSDGTAKAGSSTYEAPAKKTSANFYYGRVYAPYYEGPVSGFKAKIYYGAYCDGCDKNLYMKHGATQWEICPSTISWFTNPTHHAGVLKFEDFCFANKTILRNDVSAVSNGEQLIFVSNQRPVVDIARMHANSWLLCNEFDENAQTNDFMLKFLVPNGDWAGKTLKKGSDMGEVGKVIGAEENFKELSDKTNRRICW